MSRYFSFKEDTPESRKDISKIREYLEFVGDLNCSNRDLYILWYKFSSSWHANWLDINIETLKPFADWLSSYNGDLS